MKKIKQQKEKEKKPKLKTGELSSSAELKKAQEQILLKTSALMAAANGIVITDKNGFIQWVNPAFTRLTGYEADEVIGQHTRILKSGRQNDEYYKKLWETIRAGEVWRGELVNKKKNGTFYNEVETITPVKNADGEITHFIAIKSDITEKKNHEERRRNFLAALGHELRNTLAPISLWLELMEYKFNDEESRTALGIISHQTANMKRLINDLMDVSRLENGKMELDKKEVDLYPIMEKAAQSILPSIKKKEQKLEVLTPRKPVVIFADALRIEQVFTNLLQNASKYSGNYSPIFFGAEISPSEVLIKVKDSGMGISPRMLERIFDMFAREASDKGSEGLGIGLHLARELAHLHGGEITPRAKDREREVSLL
ncbi:PAS domain S-box protein [Candidatus Giovannonibacteria bacterium]|nr:PAS domain S-box protein [Candidatus Giovannonibacteria bacterium]